jgi:hypothetical protein
MACKIGSCDCGVPPRREFDNRIFGIVQEEVLYVEIKDFNHNR